MGGLCSPCAGFPAGVVQDVGVALLVGEVDVKITQTE